jgi:SAM-dependent methyltransferase
MMTVLLDRLVAEQQRDFWSSHRIPREVATEVSPNDEMWDGPEHYLRVGASALAAIQSFANLWGLKQFSSILEFGCGHGRVLRWLKAAYPDAIVVGTDIDEGAREFCERTLGCQSFPSFVDVDRISPKQKFDCIFAGSVVTHLPEQSSKALLNQFMEWLEPGGLCVFTSHGATAANSHITGSIDYTMGGDRAHPLLGYYDTGYGYADYPTSIGKGLGYGVTFIKPEWFLSHFKSDGRIKWTSVVQHGWDCHQDVIAFCKR